MRLFFYCLIFLIALPAFAQKKSKNPAAEGFNFNGSDPKAIQLADEVMEAIGGRKAWDKSRYITWKFFSFRKLTFDRYTGDVRILDIHSNMITLMNINTNKGKVMKMGEVLSDTSLEHRKAIERGRKLLFNDSYWLLMPMKLKDSGVTLKYIGEDSNKEGHKADVIQLTFNNVGVSPDNKYWVYIDKNTKLVNQWAFFRKATDEKPEFINVWSDYKKYGKILLSSNRGREEGIIGEIEVHRKIDRSIFSTF
jgi:hypothetical protein